MEFWQIITLIALAVVQVAALVLLSKRMKPSDLDPVTAKITADSDRIHSALRAEFSVSREEISRGMADSRKELADSVKRTEDSLLNQLRTMANLQKDQLDGFQQHLDRVRTENTESLKSNRSQFSETVDRLQRETSLKLDDFSKRIERLTTENSDKHNQLKESVERKLWELQESNSKKLDEMRRTVDEKLHDTLEKRLGESFKLVGEKLESVHKGLGEMQTLAVGVGDLKKVLTNVKARGTWGEFQLSALLEEMLSPEQYQANVKIRPDSREVVEFAVKLPGSDEKTGPVFLPLDSKFPKEDYERLQHAQEQGNVDEVAAATAALITQIKKCAKDINEKYIEPPYSTDFAVMFLPVESLYAEIQKVPGLASHLQSQYRVMVAGPTTLCALLTSLQMGFRSLAVQKRSSEVWSILGSVKNEFEKFGGLLDKVGKQLQTAQNTIASATTKTRTIERKLREVEESTASQALDLNEPDFITDSSMEDLERESDLSP